MPSEMRIDAQRAASLLENIGQVAQKIQQVANSKGGGKPVRTLMLQPTDYKSISTFLLTYPTLRFV